MDLKSQCGELRAALELGLESLDCIEAMAEAGVFAQEAIEESALFAMNVSSARSPRIAAQARAGTRRSPAVPRMTSDELRAAIVNAFCGFAPGVWITPVEWAEQHYSAAGAEVVHSWKEKFRKVATQLMEEGCVERQVRPVKRDGMTYEYRLTSRGRIVLP